MNDQVARLQAAVEEMLAEIRVYEEYENTMRISKIKLSTLQDYGLTQEDME